MKIFHVSNFTMKWDGITYWSLPYKLTNGFVRLGHHVFSFCDRDIADSYLFGMRALGKGYVNRKLLKACEQVRPDLLLLGHCTLISPATIEAIREKYPSLRIAHWNCDALFIPSTLSRLQSLAPIVDATFVTTGGEPLAPVSKGGGRAAFMPNPVDKSIESFRVFDFDNVQNDLVFITHGAPEKERVASLVRTALPDLKFDVRGMFGRPSVYGAEMFEVLARAKMGLNISQRNDVFLYSSDRMSVLVGNGLLTFIDRRTGFDTIFSDAELAFYDDDHDLVEKLRFYKANDAERRRVAENGWKRAHEIFDATLVAQWIIDITFDHGPSRAYAWPTTVYERDSSPTDPSVPDRIRAV